MSELYPGRVYNLPSVAVVGWIPYIDHSLPLPPQLHQLSWRMGLAAKFLFATGNPVPNITSRNDLGTLIPTKEFRVALALDRVRVMADGEGVHISARMRSEAGFTPIDSIIPPKLRVGFPTPARQYEPGSYRRRLKNRRGEGRLDVHFAFKIGTALSWLQMPLTFHLAPWAVVRLKYHVLADGRFSIQTYGSHVPSQKIYVDWQEQATTDMQAISAASLAGFITTGNCRRASMACFFRYRDRIIP